MDPNLALALGIMLVAALVLTAYDTFHSPPPTCPECPHCRSRQRDAVAPTVTPPPNDRASLWNTGDDRRMHAVSALPPHEDHESVRRILVAYDGGVPARRALARAIELTRAWAASLSVISVVPYARFGRVHVEPWDDAAVHAGQLEEARRTLATEGLSADLIERTGEPARVIEQLAEEGEYDAIVIGSRGATRLVRALTGSVSAHVSAHTRRTVIIVH